ESSYFGMAGNMTAGSRMSNFQATVATNVKLLNVRQENNSNVPFTHVVDSYYTGMHSANVDANITTLGSLFRLGVGRTISGSTFKIIALGSSTQLLFDGGGNVSQTSVVDDST